jgi:hypothetical protein
VNKIQKWSIIIEKKGTSLSYLNTAAVYIVTTNVVGVDGTLEALGHCIAICGKAHVGSMHVQYVRKAISLF